MDWELAKRLRKVARTYDMRNRVIEADRPANACPTCQDGILTVEDGSRCRQCVLMSRMFAQDAA